MDQVFRALADPSRRRLPGRLNDRTGQTLRELCAGQEVARQSATGNKALRDGLSGRGELGEPDAEGISTHYRHRERPRVPRLGPGAHDDRDRSQRIGRGGYELIPSPPRAHITKLCVATTE